MSGSDRVTLSTMLPAFAAAALFVLFPRLEEKLSPAARGETTAA